MGLRTASVRRPHVDVMAPALTETKQQTNFIPATNQTTSLASPINVSGNFIAREAITCKKLSTTIETSEPSEISITTAATTTTTPTANDVFDNLSTLALATELLNLNRLTEKNHMMNNLNDEEDDDVKMGLLQKSASDGLVEDVAALLKANKNEEDVEEDLFDHFAHSGGDDIMQEVIKSIEGERNISKNVISTQDEIFPSLSTSDLTGNLKDIFNDCDDVMNLSIDDATTMKEQQTNELLNDVQKRNAKMERRLDFLERRLRKFQIRLMGQHVSGEIGGVFEHVHRTIKRSSHKDNNLINNNNNHNSGGDNASGSGVINNSSSTGGDGEQQQSSIDNLQLQQPQQQQQQQQIEQSKILEKLKPISYSSTKNLVKKLETSAAIQANNVSRQRHSSRYFGSGSTDPSAIATTTSANSSSSTASTFRTNNNVLTLPQWTVDDKRDLQRISGYLQSEVKLVQEELDSEATVSSSGGESCDEMQNYNNPHQQFLPIHKRAAWKYAMDRAAIACRWTWLQSQVSDLEYRIRQHSDLHRKIRSSKECVKLGGASPSHSVPSSPTTTTAAAATATTTNCVNGYRGQLPGASPIKLSYDSMPANGTHPTTASASSSPLSATETERTDIQCARTRPLMNFRKRKLLQLNGLHVVSKKAARSSTVKCGCVGPYCVCALCTGRTDPTYPRDMTDYLSKNEKLGLLDPSYHPVFALNEDASAALHMEAIMKTSEWQQRSSRSNLKSLKYVKGDRIDKTSNATASSSAAGGCGGGGSGGVGGTTNAGEQRPRKSLEHRRKYNRLIKTSTANALSAKIKNRFRGRKPIRHSSLKKRSRLLSQMQSLGSDGADEEVEALGINSTGGGKYDSPSTSPLLTAQTISGYQRRNRVDSYDIDNIIIPYSVAASTRVEKLPYKEILTPKWRIAESDNLNNKYDAKNNGIMKTSQEKNYNEEDEDLSEDAVVIRHEKSEIDEKKKFLSYLKLPIGYGRSRANRRTDSRAESSGANTPDPMSPAPQHHNTIENIEKESVTISPMASPPATPLSVCDDNSSSSTSNLLRRRTISQSRNSLLTTTTAAASITPPVNTTSINASSASSATLAALTTATSTIPPPPTQSTIIKDNLLLNEMRSNTPEQIEVQPPYEKRLFPLHEELYEKMLKSMPDEHKLKTNSHSQDSSAVHSPAGSDEFDEEQSENKINEFHDSESTESAFGDEDPNDPEWDIERMKERHRR